MANLRKDKLLKITKRGHSWHRVVPVEVNKKKAVTVHIFLLPKVSDGYGASKVVLYVTAEVKSSLLTRLNTCCEDSWVMVETEVMDHLAGKKYGFTDFTPRAIDADDGKIGFCQDLVTCEDVKKCRTESVDVVIKVTFITCQRDDFTLHDEDGFCVVSHK